MGGGGGPPELPSSTKTVTTTTVSTTTITRLKREEFRQTKHDSAFSKWRVLIGPSDWSDYEARKDGAERYRVGNLPEVARSGVYEIGVAVCATCSGRDVAKIEAERMIVVVYLGQADNVRSRLQEYGRSGSHLVYGVGLFRDVFARGYPIVYRWAPMKSKTEAESTEAQLLERFDYAWNKLGNGSRRPNDILKKMDMISSKKQNTPSIFKMLQALTERKVGVPIKAEKLSLDSKPTPDESFGFFGRVLKFSRSRPTPVSADETPSAKDFNKQTVICGATSSDRTICTKPPVEGRKRCAEHKGMRLARKSVIKDSGMKGLQQENCPSNITDNVNVSDGFSLICGVTQHDGSPCARPPLPGRKRCMEHKGMRVNQAMSKSSNLKSEVIVSLSDSSLAEYCGVQLSDGKCCTRKPVKGRKRCEEHKGMRVDAYVSKLSSRNKWFNAKLAYSNSCRVSAVNTALD